MYPMAGIIMQCSAQHVGRQAPGAGAWDRSQPDLHSTLHWLHSLQCSLLCTKLCLFNATRTSLAWLITCPAPLCLCRAIIAAHNLQLLPDYASHNEHWTLNSKWIVQTAQEFRSVKRVVLYRSIIRLRLRSGVSGSQIVWYGGCEVQQPLLTCAGTSLQQLSTFVCRCFPIG